MPAEVMLPVMQKRPAATMTTAAIFCGVSDSRKSRGENSSTSIGPA